MDSRAKRQHRLNSLHLLCALKRAGFPDWVARPFARVWEIMVHGWLYATTRGRINMIKHLLIALGVVAVAGVAGSLIGWRWWAAPSVGLIIGELSGAGALVLALWLLGRFHVNK